MVKKALIRTVVGIIGNIISFFLFASPAPTFYKIWKAKSVQEFKPDPYVVTLLNCAMWVFYGLPFVTKDSILVLTINAVGFAIEAVYVMLFFNYSDWAKRRRICFTLVAEAILYAVLVATTLIFLHGKKRSLPVGIMCLLFNIGMYFSPLTIMFKVIKTKSVKYMPFYLSLANFANGTIWFFYAFLKFDPFILIPNGLGAISGLIQLALYAYYYNSTNWYEDDRPSSIQLSDNASRV